MDHARRPRTGRRDPRLVALAEESGYEVRERIGAGGMGIVYRALDADGHDVAIKLLRHEIADDPRARERLAREVAAQKLVRSENIVRIVDAELDSADAFVVTEFIPGPTLEDAVRDHGGLHPEAVREIGLVLGEALRRIHGAGVIHRDLKPSNVLLRDAQEEDLISFDPDGDRLDPVIIDFGIAIAAEESRLTSTGLVMGTAAYLDPEVISTNSTGEAGDWWALSALLAFAATGREPFGTGRADLVLLRAERGEIDVDGAPTELAAWLRAALTADPAARPDPQSMLAELAELDLARYDDPGPTEALDARGRTIALPGGGAAEGDASSRSASSADDSGPATEALSAGAPTEALRGGAPTEALPAARTGSARSDDADATQVLPTLGGGATQGLPAVDAPPPTPQGAPTEAIPMVGPPTLRMPPIREDIPGPGTAAPAAAQPMSGGRPVRRGVQDQPMAGQGYAAGPGAPGDGRQFAPASQGQFAPTAQGQAGPLAPWPSPEGMQAPPGGWPPQPAPPPRRPVLVWLGHLLLVALAGVAPYVALTVLLLLGAMARTWERTARSVASARLRGSTGSGPLWGAGLAIPFRFLLGLLETALQALLPLVLGLLVGLAIDVAWTMTSPAAPPDGIAFAVAMAITLLITWVGVGSRTTRNGAHRMVDAAAPDRVWTAILLGLLLLLVAAVGTTLIAREGMVDYFPFVGGPRLEDIAFWRR